MSSGNLVKKTKERYTKKRSWSERMLSLIEKNLMFLVIILLLVAIVLPILVIALYRSPIKLFATSITEGELLGYLGNILCGLIALGVAFIPLYQDRKNRKKQDEKDAQMRKLEIAPCLRIDIKRVDEKIYDLTINNDSNNPALSVWLFEYHIAPIIKGNNKKKCKFAIGKSNQVVTEVHEFHVDEYVDVYPKEINLVYGDVDNNIISTYYQYYIGIGYEKVKTEYE